MTTKDGSAKLANLGLPESERGYFCDARPEAVEPARGVWEKFLNWARANSLWILGFGTGCGAIELRPLMTSRFVLSAALRKQGVAKLECLRDEEDRLTEGTDTAPVLPLAPRKPMNKKLSGHPCFHLNAEIPPNFTANECQGICTSQQRGYSGRPCFWGSLSAKECPAFERKHILPTELPTKAAR